MNKLWDSLIRPIIEEIDAKYIVEIGSESGINTKNILDYCEANDARMTAIDPLPGFDVEEFKNKYGDKFEIYQELSLSRLPLLKDYDVILIDGDHNWYTVYNELKIIEKTFKDKEFPLVFLHDVGWPYGRRDLYYNPENIPEAFRQPYKKEGMYPGESNLKDKGGINRHLYNSIYENNPQNGVLTALEDFMAESTLEFSFEIVNVFHGLGILFPKNNEMKNIIKDVLKSANLLENLEEQRLKIIIENSESNKKNKSLEEHLNKLKTEKNKIESTLKESQNNNKTLEQKLNELKTEKNKIESTLKESQNNNKTLEQKLNELKTEKNKIESTLKESQNNNKTLEQKLNKLEKERDKLIKIRKEKIELESKYTELNKTNGLLKKELNEGKVNFEHLESQLRSSLKSINEKEKIINQIRKQEQELNDKFDNLTTDFYKMEYLSNKNRSIIQRLISRFPSLYILFNVNETGFRNALINIKGYSAIKNNDLFDIGFYLKNNPHIKSSGIDPILHYIYHGFKEGKKPNSSFDEEYYLKIYKDVKKLNINPLVHYSLYGLKENKKTFENKETTLNKDKKRKKGNNSEIITKTNKNLGNKSFNKDYVDIANSGLFDINWYLNQYNIELTNDPITHYLDIGVKKRYNPNKYFNTNYYLTNNRDVANTNINPLIHFIRYGAKENRDPHPLFSTSLYLKENPDVVASKMNPLLHYINYGIREGRGPVILTEEQLKEKYDEIITKNKSEVKLYPFDWNAPIVSIIILNRNGISHLKRLFKDFKENIQYPNYEIILVDNASTDASIEFLETLPDNLHITIIKNTENESFSKANNEAAHIAKGDYLLLLNNDVEPLYGWLNQMMRTALKSDDIGAVGAKLVYPDCSNSIYNSNSSFKVQHMGIAFKEEDDFIKPYNLGGLEPFSPESNLEKERSAITAAALLVEKEKYWEVNGLDEEYSYGYEDVDLSLKLLKTGYKNIYCPKAVLFHYEFGTQEKTKNNEVRDRRLNNRKIFRKKWNPWLKKQLFVDKLDNIRLFSENPLKIALTVTETGEDASAGDYFTGLELGEGLKKLGYEVSFLSRRGPGNWYEVSEDIDILISLLDVYDPQKVKCSNKSLIKIAWCRNWIDRWLSHSYFNKFDIILVSSQITRNYIKEKVNIDSHLFPIATNETRFNDNSPKDEYLCDYCFTGNYWGVPREIIEQIDPDSIPFKFKIYGKDWNNLNKFKKYHQGFVNYLDIPKVYASTKIVIDDAVNITKKEGSVNSRVFDALASGVLVLTNGDIGARETFNDKIPIFKSKKELSELITYYLENEDARLAKINELQEFVLENHTYEIRANTLKDVIMQYFLKPRIAIKMPIPKWDEVHEWGDYHFAIALKKEFEKKNCEVLLQILPEWNNGEDSDFDVVLVLRGLSKYKPKPHHFNIMWNISHPDKVSDDEYNEYDHVLIASEFWARKIKERVNVPVDALLQCTAPELFYPQPGKEEHELLFVGNSRKVFRKIIKDLFPTDYDISIYGTNWEDLICSKYIKGRHIPNNELRKAYSSCKILLNDHWDDMREKGFISNRLFDGFASGAFIISDYVKDAEDIFGDALVTYEDAEELNNLIEYYLDNKDERIEKLQNARNIVISDHTYEKRANHILKTFYKSMQRKMKVK